MTAFVGMKCRALTLGAGSDVAIRCPPAQSVRLVGNAVFRETNPSVAGVRQPGKPEVSGRRDAAEREHLQLSSRFVGSHFRWHKSHLDGI